MAEPYTRRIVDFNLNGPISQPIFTVPQQDTYVLRHLVWSPTSNGTIQGIYVESPGGAVRFHLARTAAGNGATQYIDLRQELLPGERLIASFPAAGQSANGAITCYVLSRGP